MASVLPSGMSDANRPHIPISCKSGRYTSVFTNGIDRPFDVSSRTRKAGEGSAPVAVRRVTVAGEPIPLIRQAQGSECNPLLLVHTIPLKLVSPCAEGKL